MEEIITATEFLARLRTAPAPSAPQEYVVAGTAARRLCVIGAIDLSGQVFDLPVRVAYVDFAWPVELTAARTKGDLQLQNCQFKAGLCLRDLHVQGRLSLRGTRLSNPAHRWLDFRRLRVAGLTDLTCVTAAVGIDLTNAILEDDIRLDGLRGWAALRTQDDIPSELAQEEQEHLRNEMLGKAINAEGAEIRKHLFVYAFGSRRFHIHGQFDLRSQTGGSVAFSKARVNAGTGGITVNMDAATVGGSVFFTDDTAVSGTIDLRAKVSGSVEFAKVTVNAGTDGTAVNMAEATVGGSVLFRNDTAVSGTIDLRAKISGNVEFLKVTVNAGTGGIAVIMAAATVGGSVLFRNDTAVSGTIDLRAKIDGQVAFEKVTVNAGTGGTAVDMEAATVGGMVFMRMGTRFVGNIRLFKAQLLQGLGGTTDPTQPEFRQPTAGDETRELLVVGDLELSYATVHGPMLFHGASIWGKVTADHLHVHGDLDWCHSIIGPAPPTANQMKQLLEAMNPPPTPFDRPGKPPTLSDLNERLPSRAPQRWTRIETERPIPDQANAVEFEMKMAKVEGHLWFKGTRLLTSLNLDESQVSGEANVTNGLIAGNLSLRSAKIEGTAFAEDPKTANPVVHGFVDLSYAKLGQLTMRFDSKARQDTPAYVNLTGTEVGVLQLRGQIASEERGPNSRGVLVGEGLKFQHVKLDENVMPATHLRPTWRDYARHGVWLCFVVSVSALAHHDDNWPFALAVGAYITVSVAARVSWLPALFLATGVGSIVAASYEHAWLAFYLLVSWLVIVLAIVLGHTDLFIGPPKPNNARLTATQRMEHWLALLRKGCCRCVQVPRESAAVLNLLAWSYPFSRGLYIAVENWLRNAGDDARADEAFLMRRKRETGRPQPAPQVLAKAVESDPALKEAWQTPSKAMTFLNGLFDFALGFGVRWGRLVHVYLLLFLLSIGVFLSPRSVERPISYQQPRFDALKLAHEKQDPTHAARIDDMKDADKAAENPWPADGGVPSANEWGFVNAAFMALRVQVPVLTLGAENDWEPASRPMLGKMTYEEYGSLMVVANFILIPLIIAGITRQMRK